MTKQEREEQWVMEIFLRVCGEPGLRIIAKQESPDFLITNTDKLIGIELTEVFQDSDKGHSKLQEFSSVAGSFTDDLIKKIQPFIPFSFAIGIEFNQLSPVKKSSRKKLLQKTAEICIPVIRKLLNSQHLDLDNYYANLPEEIEHISAYRYDDFNDSYNFKPEGGIVSRLTLDHVQPIISRKEGKLEKYTRCDEQWLVIREGNYYAGSFSDVNIELPVTTTFDKIFLLRTRTEELLKLK